MYNQIYNIYNTRMQRNEIGLYCMMYFITALKGYYKRLNWWRKYFQKFVIYNIICKYGESSNLMEPSSYDPSFAWLFSTS